MMQYGMIGFILHFWFAMGFDSFVVFCVVWLFGVVFGGYLDSGLATDYRLPISMAPQHNGYLDRYRS
ncbi:hypothetical protein EYC80_007355 [Monilinia laxa]|uniref:Uncharacterized protein n=1 Tax=Monilinia laxa TaxID=61186 RepID=A0A5N6JUF0_MONLA|nr:hypothetical protein EYC80_007355 [Monilinia laxa]